jgi:hypothetical protein
VTRVAAAALGVYALVGGVAAVHISRHMRHVGYTGPRWFVVAALTWPWTTYLAARRLLGRPPLYGRPAASHGAASGPPSIGPPS